MEGIKLFQRSEIDGFFGLFTNNLTNILVLTGLLVSSVQMPVDVVFGRILPATGFAVFLASIGYTYLGWRLINKEKRCDVTALPAGISVPHMFLIIFMIVLPVKMATGDPIVAWYAGIAWCFIEGIVALCGIAVGPWIRKHVPRAALLGSLAGVSITAIMANSALQSWEVPYIAFVTFGVILLGFVAKCRMPFNMPAGLVAIILGIIIGWATGYMSTADLLASVEQVGVHMPIAMPVAIVQGMSAAAPYLITAIPLGIYNFMESIDNVESASAAGDAHNTRQILLFDGMSTVIGSMFGGIIPIAVYIGHPGWKSVGARTGYSWLVGVSVLVLSVFGIASILISVIPLVAILPILIYIGIIIGSQAFEHVPKSHFPAVILAILPWLGDWGQTLIENTVTACGVATPSVDAFNNAGIHWLGFDALGSGAILIGIIWASILIFMMEKNEKGICIASGIGAILAFFGIIHAQTVGVCMAPGACIGYIGLAVLSIVVLRYNRYSAKKGEVNNTLKEKAN
ncbi:MAG: hypothetical protein ACOYCA_04565 [Eggerthellaceae bacterium]|jgi:AGZA family xanthine/uracil permease-like MFS transporter